MDVGTFSVSLAVKDLSASRDFYAKLGFAPIGGDGENWAILKNGDTVIGLFSGMFDRNIMTFNPGWQGPGQPAEEFTDIREIREALVNEGVTCEADTTSDNAEGPASFMIADPDGNQILFDQHV